MTLEDFYNTDWFKERPENIQELFRKFPVNKPFFLKVSGEDEMYYGIRIIGWDEPKEGEPTARIHVDGIMPPTTERDVFGIKQEDLFSEKQVEGKKISYITNPVIIVE